MGTVFVVGVVVVSSVVVVGGAVRGQCCGPHFKSVEMRVPARSRKSSVGRAVPPEKSDDAGVESLVCATVTQSSRYKSPEGDR